MLTISSSDVQKIFSHCSTALPNEACGILAGHAGNVERVYCMTNAESSPNFYRMDSAEQFKALREIYRTGLDLIGIYHSHTDSRAYPSPVDIELAYYPEAVYMIIAGDGKNSFLAKGYNIVEGTVTEVPLNILEAR